ncbi:MAG: SDR family oxidoreductase [Saprospiraceae bacterium]|nr:SDR family oxidoreductase [Saprospiraceae bacterium]
MNLDLQNKNALVCGGSRGLGKASAIELANLGANVTLLSRNEELLQQVLVELDTTKGQSHQYIVANFSDGIETLEVKIKDLLKKQSIHILINNTGGPKGGTLIDATSDQFLDAFNNHVLISHSMVNWVIPGMKKDGYGRIINIVSTSVRQPIPGLGVSNVTRGAMASWAKTLSHEVASNGITVNNILPGSTKTERLDELISAWAYMNNKTEDEMSLQLEKELPIGRFGKPEEIGGVVAFIASPAASYITGTSIPVDGGKIKSI